MCLCFYVLMLLRVSDSPTSSPSSPIKRKRIPKIQPKPKGLGKLIPVNVTEYGFIDRLHIEEPVAYGISRKGIYPETVAVVVLHETPTHRNSMFCPLFPSAVRVRDRD